MITFAEMDFLIVGAAKSATTSLQFALQSDPRISMPHLDLELHYFSRNFDRGEDWYLSQLSRRVTTLRIGERSNSYMSEPQAPNRIAAMLPHVQIIAQLRNPVERAYSHYCMLYRRGEVDRNVDTLLDPRISAEIPLITDGNYYQKLMPFYDYFPSERIKLLLYEHFREDPRAVVGQVQSFLGLPPDTQGVQLDLRAKDKTIPVIPPSLKNRLKKFTPAIREIAGGNPIFEYSRNLLAKKIVYPTISSDIYERLFEHYAQSINQLSKLSGFNLECWSRNESRQSAPDPQLSSNSEPRRR